MDLGPRPTVYGPRTGVEALGWHHFQSNFENCSIIAHDIPVFSMQNECRAGELSVGGSTRGLHGS